MFLSTCYKHHYALHWWTQCMMPGTRALLTAHSLAAGMEWRQMSLCIGGPTRSGLTSWASSPQKTAFLCLKSGLRRPSSILVRIGSAVCCSHTLHHVLSLRETHAGGVYECECVTLPFYRSCTRDAWFMYAWVACNPVVTFCCQSVQHTQHQDTVTQCGLTRLILYR